VYALGQTEAMDRLSSYWLPLIEESLSSPPFPSAPASPYPKPVILAGNKVQGYVRWIVEGGREGEREGNIYRYITDEGRLMREKDLPAMPSPVWALKYLFPGTHPHSFHPLPLPRLSPPPGGPKSIKPSRFRPFPSLFKRGGGGGGDDCPAAAARDGAVSVRRREGGRERGEGGGGEGGRALRNVGIRGP
jgi:hypothetical protein